MWGMSRQTQVRKRKKGWGGGQEERDRTGEKEGWEMENRIGAREILTS